MISVWSLSLYSSARNVSDARHPSLGLGRLALGAELIEDGLSDPHLAVARRVEPEGRVGEGGLDGPIKRHRRTHLFGERADISVTDVERATVIVDHPDLALGNVFAEHVARLDAVRLVGVGRVHTASARRSALKVGGVGAGGAC